MHDFLQLLSGHPQIGLVHQTNRTYCTAAAAAANWQVGRQKPHAQSTNSSNCQTSSSE